MHLTIAGYEIERKIESYYASSLFRARDRSSGRPAIIKTLSAAYPDIRDIKRLEREYWVLKELDDVEGVLPASDLVFHDNGNPAVISQTTGRTLSYYFNSNRASTWPLDRIVDIVIQLTTAIDAVHDHKTVHKNIAPQNILIDDADWSVKLMNFEIASALSREHQDKTISKRMWGSLPYISPEQTGRISHDVDHRSDFYSLGIVFFEMLFGRSPFDATTQLEWVHAHIGKAPKLPDDAGARVPAALANIVLRLLAKSPEDRYQSCFGLLHDLRECHTQLTKTGQIQSFRLGECDISEVFRVPQVVYGRDEELAQVTALFENVERGGTEVCLISGHSGVGKSALVEELNKPIVRSRGYILRGKFDQFERAKPYAGISAAFSGLVHELLAEPADRLATWKTRITEALGGNAQAMIDVLPDLEKIIGPQDPVPALPPTEAQNRLQLMFISLVRLLTGSDRPVVIYLDDLQWSDAPTLNLLQKFATARDISNLFILGAYRSNEIDSNHLLSLARNEISKVRPVHEVSLQPLARFVVNQILSTALRTDVDETDRLSAVLYRKTEGNPFFVNELLKSLVDDGLIRFERAQGRWTWDVDAINKADVGSDVVDFLLGNLGKLPDETKQTLRMAACIGHEFDMQKLAVVHQRPKKEIGLALMSALARNIILPLDDSYQLFDEAASRSETPIDAAMNPRFRFQHDRLHQAAYDLIDADDKERVHLSIGRLLQEEASDEPSDESVIKIVRHLNEAIALISDADPRVELAQLNLKAARVAHDASSYPAALHYLQVGRSLLPLNAWENHYELSKEFSALYAQTVYLVGRHDDADQELSMALEHLRTALEKAQVLSMRTRHYSTSGRMADSIVAALQGLQLLGIEIERDVSDDTVSAEIEAISRNLGEREIADLIDAGRMTNPEMATAIGLLMEIFPAAFLSGAGNLFYFLVLRSVNLSLQFGSSTETAFAYAAYGMLLCGGLDRPAEGFEYGKLALKMNDSFEDIGLKSRIIYLYGMFIHHWSRHWTSMTEWFKKGIEAGYQSGDLLYLAYNAQDCIIWDPKLDIPAVIEGQTKYLEVVQDCNYMDSYDSGSLFLQMYKNFAGETIDQFSLTSETFDERSRLDGIRSRKFMTGVANFNIYKAEIHYLYGDSEGALPFVEAQEELIDSVMSLPQSTRFRFVAFLTYASICLKSPRQRRQSFRGRMSDHLSKMQIWADNCPENFRHLYLAMIAELARLDGDMIAALKNFEAAIQGAAASGFTRDQAMIHERYGNAFEAMGLEAAATTHLRAARQLFYRWGADRKVAQLDAQYPSLEQMSFEFAPVAGSARPPTVSDTGISQEALDLDAVMNATRAISGEIVLEQLLSKTMNILIESTGAQRGFFISRNAGDLTIESTSSVTDRYREANKTPYIASPDDIPHSVVNYVLRTQKPLVIDNGLGHSQFNEDPYRERRDPKSVMCVPVLRSENLEGVILLENDLASGAFSDERLGMVELLAAQASISIENAKLYDDLEQKVDERTAELRRKSIALSLVANQLSKYLSPQVYRSIFDRDREVRVASERKHLTIFFSDLVGFTEVAENMESGALTRLLNDYLSEMSDVALSFGATVDKFVGDGIVIFFGDPESRGVKNDAVACAKMAIAMRKRLSELRQGWLDQGIEKPLDCRMGIHTGFCTVGNFGSETRMDYTIIGRAVNLASRLESAAETGSILISQSTFEQIKDQVDCVRKGQIDLRGIARPVQTYEIVDIRKSEQ